MAQAKTIELVAANTVATGDGEGLKKRLPTITMAIVGIDVTAASGTTPKFTAWLQVSDDGGTTWYDFPADLILKSSAIATDLTATANARNICDEIDETGEGQYLAIYKHIPSDYVRLKRLVSGTTPSYTFSANLVGK